MNSTTIEIGQKLTVIPLSSNDRRTWTAECAELPSGWSCELLHRAETDIIPNRPLVGWILEIDLSRHVTQVSDSNFGFLPISDRMRPRYVAALRHLAALFKGGRNMDSEDSDALSEVKGMFSRCARRDQWDWHAVHLVLGAPDRDTARNLANRLGEIARLLRQGEVKVATSHLEALRSDALSNILQAAAETIVDSAPRIAKVRVAKGQRHVHLQKETAGSVISTCSKDKLDTANATHEQLLSILEEFLGSRGHRIESNQFVDAFSRLKSGPAVFEAKSLTNDNEMSQVRHGLSQLYEYRYRHGLENATLWLLLSRPPKEEWLLDYLEKDRGVHVLWPEDGELCGPMVARLLESGSEAMRRKKED